MFSILKRNKLYYKFKIIKKNNRNNYYIKSITTNIELTKDVYFI